MNQHEATGAGTGTDIDAAAATPADERYRLTHNSQIGTVLRDLSWQKCMLSVRTRTGHQFVTSVLHVDPVNRTFVFDWCNADAERQSLMTSEENAFSGLLRGVPVNFMVGIKGKCFSVEELRDAGVKRISLATSLYRAAMAGLMQAAREVKEQGTFDYVERL